MTILSSKMVGFSYPAYPAFPACSRQGTSLLSSIFLPRFPRLFAAGYLPLVFHFLTPLPPLVRGPLPLKKRGGSRGKEERRRGWGGTLPRTSGESGESGVRKIRHPAEFNH
jgi:hypothetical protein